MAAAPPASYSTASAAGSAISASAPLLGLERLTSAITATPGPRNRGIGSIAGSTCWQRSFSRSQRDQAWRDGEVLPDPGDDVVQCTHSARADQSAPWPMTCSTLVAISETTSSATATQNSGQF